MKYKNKKGFSLSEALIFLLVACMLLAASMPVITKKYLIMGARAAHGKWACKLINGKYYSASAANANKSLPDEEKWTEGCIFPSLPSSVKYLVVKVIGGGGGGHKGSLTVGKSEESDVLFPRKVDGDVYNVMETGKYEIVFVGLPGENAQLSPNFLSIILNGKTFRTCNFDLANGNKSVPYVKFEFDLQKNDKLYYKYKEENNSNQYNNEEMSLCDSSRPARVEWQDEYNVTNIADYYFANIEHSPGKNGMTVQLILKRDKEPGMVLAEIKGSGGGYYVSSSDACSVDCSLRYVPRYDRMNLQTKDSVSFGSAVKSGMSSGVTSASDVSRIMSKSNTINVSGGCGGAAGQTNTVLMFKPDKTDFKIKIGKGGLSDTDGENTEFDYVTAYGGVGCSSEGPSSSPGGRDGEASSYLYDNDSKGGKGGEGGVGGLLVPALDKLHGGNASGIGAGGGGGGVSFDIKMSIKEYLEKGDFTDTDNIKKFGIGGNGTSGGVIITW